MMIVADSDIHSSYKPAGIQTGSVAGKVDGFEGFLVSDHSLLSECLFYFPLFMSHFSSYKERNMLNLIN